MREILFRGKRVSNGEWVEGYLIHDEFCNTQIPYIGYLTIDGCNVADVIPETVGQYTGLTDKNGTKIFEGDYWLDTDGDYIVYVVEFRDGQFCFVSYGVCGALMPYGYDEDAGGFGEIECEPFSNFNIELVEIEGNIHDNPKILEDERCAEWYGE